MLRRSLLASALLAVCHPAVADPEINALRAEIQQLKSMYESRLAELEARLKAAEANSARPDNVRDKLGQVSSGTAFNPQLSVILDGVYYTDNRKGEAPALLEELDGINHVHHHEGHGHSQLERGFNLRPTEVVFSASVDPYFDAYLMLTVASDGGVELEEAYFDTRSLPAGLKLRGGKFLSGIGYLNSQHPHTWDFVDQNLPYRTLLGEHGLIDTGLQLNWLPKTGSLYTLLGVELLQGNDQVFATAGLETPTARLDGNPLAPGSAGELSGKKAGPRLLTAFAKFSPTLGDNHALQIGLWGARARQHQEVHDHTLEDAASLVHALEGKSWLWGTDWVYKYDAPGAYGQGDLSLSAEYLRERKNLHIAFHEDGALVGQPRKFTQDGLYLSAVYGFAPRWQVGVRYDVTGLTNKVEGSTGVLRNYNDSNRWTLSLTHHFSEFSRLRLQASTADLWVDGEQKNVNQFFIQYQHSLGAHGAHKF